MAFLLSPGVHVAESDLTNIVPAVATSIGGYVGTFKWGPVLSITTINSQNTLVKTFSKPDDATAASFFSAANFLDYANQLKIVRVVGANALNATADGSGILIKNYDDYEANYTDGTTHPVGGFAAKYPGSLGNSIEVSMADSATFNTWVYKNNFSTAPTGTDGLHVIVIDKLGLFTGVVGGILEKFAFVSKAFDSKASDGSNNYYVNVLARNSQYVWWMSHPSATTNWGGPLKTTTFDLLASPVVATLTSGADDNSMAQDSILLEGWDLFKDAEHVDVNLLVTGPVSAAVSKYVIQNVAEARMDCIAFASPTMDVAVNNVNAVSDIIAWRSNSAFNVNSSYGALDSGWKYQYDQYNDKYRWIPLNGDIAGLHARTDDTNDAWWAAGGLNRGQIKNVVKLSVNPNQTARDQLYQAGINPVVSFSGLGIVLWGNKTLLSKPSAFDRINVRRLFIVLEKAISTAAKYSIFEFNDAPTRAQFVSMVSPFLRMVQGRRGITAFKVVADTTNNTQQVISSNSFVGDIYIQPNYSSEFIYLNFIASNNSATFSEQG